MQLNQVKSIKHVLRSLILSTLVLSLVACGSIRKIEVTTASLERIPLTLSSVDTLELDEVTWIIITPENIDQIFRDLEKKNFDIVLFALTDNGYENLSVNMAKIKKIVLQQKTIIAAYKRYYEMQSNEIEKHDEDHDQKEKEAAETNRKAEEESFIDKITRFVPFAGFLR